MSDNNLQKAGIGMELTKQEKKEQKKREKEEKKRQKAENKTPMDPAKKKKIIKRSVFGAVAGVFVLFIRLRLPKGILSRPSIPAVLLYRGK